MTALDATAGGWLGLVIAATPDGIPNRPEVPRTHPWGYRDHYQHGAMAPATLHAVAHAITRRLAPGGGARFMFAELVTDVGVSAPVVKRAVYYLRAQGWLELRDTQGGAAMGAARFTYGLTVPTSAQVTQ